MIERIGHNRSSGNKRRNDDRWHTDSVTVEAELSPVLVRRGGGWRLNMIIRSAVLVIDNEEKSLIPGVRGTECFIDVGDQGLPSNIS